MLARLKDLEKTFPMIAYATRTFKGARMSSKAVQKSSKILKYLRAQIKNLERTLKF